VDIIIGKGRLQLIAAPLFQRCAGFVEKDHSHGQPRGERRSDFLLVLLVIIGPG
jgi:hypothetical protein